MIRFTKPCDKCGGTGNEMGEFFDCPSCVGGWLPDDETVEAAAKVIASHSGIKPAIWDLPEWKGDRMPWLRDARAALVAAARYQSETGDGM